jgi:hypothetical protein
MKGAAMPWSKACLHSQASRKITVFAVASLTFAPSAAWRNLALYIFTCCTCASIMRFPPGKIFSA